MKINEYGAVILTAEELFDNLYSGKLKNFNNIFTDSATADQFNQCISINKDDFKKLSVFEKPEEDIKFFDEANQCTWFMPDQYQSFPIVHWLHSKCQTDEQVKRVDQELELFIQHGMFDLLFYLKYLVDTMREHNVVWGVGRGSSVSSYVLYLLGIHKIDSIKYELDINEFLK